MRMMCSGLLALLIGSTGAKADYAFVLTKTICDNQADSMDVAWYKQNNKSGGTMHLFSFNSGTPGFEPIAPGDNLNAYAEIAFAAHGSEGKIAGVSRTSFATALKSAHPATPTNVFFMVCSSASAPSGQLSVLGEVAARYPGQAKGSTAIGTLSGTVSTCQLRKPLSNACGGDIGQAVYYGQVATTTDGDKIIGDLGQKWEKDIYPGSQLTYKKYCEQMGRAQIPAFLDQVYERYSAQYLNLINQNSGGSAPYVCGAATPSPICK